MTQDEKAREVLSRLFSQPYYVRRGVSEKFLREYAAKKWVSKNERLTPDALIDAANDLVLTGELVCYCQGYGHSTTIYKPPAKRQFTPPSVPSDKNKNEQSGSSLATGSRLF